MQKMRRDWEKDRDKTINHMISECNKLEEKNMIKHGWVENMIIWELCNQQKFDNTDAWYKRTYQQVDFTVP